MTTWLATAATLRRHRAPATWSDKALIGACLDGHREAWDELVERYGRLVYSIPLRYGLSASDADDVFQETFTIVYRKLHTVSDASRLSSWLITIAHRESRRIGKRSEHAVVPERIFAAADEPPPEQVAAWERRHRVRQALRQLGGPCEALLVALFSAPGRPYYERIAQQCGMKVGSIGPTRARCFKKLERILADAELDECSTDAVPSALAPGLRPPAKAHDNGARRDAADPSPALR